MYFGAGKFRPRFFCNFIPKLIQLCFAFCYTPIYP